MEEEVVDMETIVLIILIGPHKDQQETHLSD